jgi:hypothetical protein
MRKVLFNTIIEFIYVRIYKRTCKIPLENQKMVANSNYFINNYHSIVNNSIVFYSFTSFHLPIGVIMKKFLKNLKETSFKMTNFVILLPIYFIGIGLSKILWYFSKLISKESGKGWIKSEKLSKRLKDYEEMY